MTTNILSDDEPRNQRLKSRRVIKIRYLVDPLQLQCETPTELPTARSSEYRPLVWDWIRVTSQY